MTGNGFGLVITDKTAIVARNTANQNTSNGIDVGTEGTQIKNNTANDNTDVGINAVPGV